MTLKDVPASERGSHISAWVQWATTDLAERFATWPSGANRAYDALLQLDPYDLAEHEDLARDLASALPEPLRWRLNAIAWKTDDANPVAVFLRDATAPPEPPVTGEEDVAALTRRVEC